MSINLPSIVYILWGIYLLFATIYVAGYLVWTINAIKWYSKIEGEVVSTAKRISDRVIRGAAVMNFLFYATIVTFGIAIMINILAVENTYVNYVIAAIVAPWIIVGILRAILGGVAKKRNLRQKTFIPRRLGILATARKETYQLGGR